MFKAHIRPKLLLTSASFAPEYGGPAVSVPRLGISLSRHGVDVGLWAPDGSAKQAAIDSSLDGLLCYAGKLSDVIEEYGPSLIHDNGIWLLYNHSIAKTCIRMGIPRVVSPRGMLEPWSLRYKKFKKKIAWIFYQRRDLKDAACLHATSEEEAKNVVSLKLGVSVKVIPNGMDLPCWDVDNSLEQSRNVDGVKTALFLSRVHPKKGLPMLIDAWAEVRPTGWRLVIAGPEELGHSEEILIRIRGCGLQNVISVVGPKYGTEKNALLRKADLFILPTHSENFGMAIAEALAHGLPVLTTKAAPWAGLREHGCGWWVDPTTDAIARGLKEALETPVSVLSEMGRRGRLLIEREYGWDRIASEMSQLYVNVIAQTKRYSDELPRR